MTLSLTSLRSIALLKFMNKYYHSYNASDMTEVDACFTLAMIILAHDFLIYTLE